MSQSFIFRGNVIFDILMFAYISDLLDGLLIKMAINMYNDDSLGPMPNTPLMEEAPLQVSICVLFNFSLFVTTYQIVYN